MNNPALVRGFERLGDLPRHPQRVLDRQSPGPWQRRARQHWRQPLGERLTFNNFEHQGPHTIRLDRTVDGPDVRMIEGGQNPCLALEARAVCGVGRQRIGKNLDRDITTELLIARAVDLSHASGAQHRQNLVAAKASSIGEMRGPIHCAAIIGRTAAMRDEPGRRTFAFCCLARGGWD